MIRKGFSVDVRPEPEVPSLLKKLHGWCTGLVDAFRYNRVFGADMQFQLVDILNELYPNKKCIRAIVTHNISKPSFGIIVVPYLAEGTVVNIVIDDKPVDIHSYSIEIDTKIIDEGYNAGELTTMIVYEVNNLFTDAIIPNIRGAIDFTLANSAAIHNRYAVIDKVIRSIDIFKFAITHYIITALSLYNGVVHPETVTRYPYMDLMDLNEIYKDCVCKIGLGDSPENKDYLLNIFEWAFQVYENPFEHVVNAIYTIKESKKMLASQLELQLLSKVQEDLNKYLAVRQDSKEDIAMQEAAVALREGFSIVKGIKMNGLRSIENDLYEFKIRVKNCDEQEDGMYTLRQINTRISILDDYIRQENISDATRERWQGIMNDYIELRTELSKKKLGPKKQYGIFIDYDKIDQIE